MLLSMKSIFKNDDLIEFSANANIPGIPYELPDGQMIDLGTERFKVPELLFNPAPYNQPVT